MVVSHYLAYDSYSNLFIAVTKESDEISTKSPSNEDILEIKLEPDDFCNSIVNVSEQIENNSDCTELAQNVDKFGGILSGSYCY